MNVTELLNGTLEDAIEKIASIAAGTRSGLLQKTAAPAWLSSLGEAVKNPAISHAMIGGGLGAAALGTNAFLDNQRDPNKKRSVMGSVLAGGLLGAGVGAGTGLARNHLSGLGEAGGGISGTHGMRPGIFTDPVTGRKMQVDPKALQDHPDLNSKLRELSTPSLQSRASSGFFSALGAVNDAAPITTPIVGALAGADALMHNPMFGLAKIRPEQAGGYIGTVLQRAGAAADKDLPEPLRNAIKRNVPLNSEGVQVHPNVAPGGPNRLERVMESLRTRMPKVFGQPRFDNPPGVADALGRHTGDVHGTRPLLTVTHTPTKEVKVITTGDAAADGGKGAINSPDVPSHKETRETTETQKLPPKHYDLNEGQSGALKEQGSHTHPTYKGRQLYKTLGHTYAGASHIGTALGRRALLFAPPVALEYLARGELADSRNKKTMKEIMEQYAKPVPENK